MICLCRVFTIVLRLVILTFRDERKNVMRSSAPTMLFACFALAIPAAAVPLERGRAGLEALPVHIRNTGGEDLSCGASLAHWYSEQLGHVGAGKTLSATLFVKPGNRRGVSAQRLGGPYAGRAPVVRPRRAILGDATGNLFRAEGRHSRPGHRSRLPCHDRRNHLRPQGAVTTPLVGGLPERSGGARPLSGRIRHRRLDRP